MNMMTIANEAQTMSSREIAEIVESQHTNVKISMERLRDKGLITFVATQEKGLGRPTQLYHVRKRDSYIIVAQLSPEFTGRLVDRWQELETKQLAGPSDEEIMMRGYILTMQKYEALQIENKQQAEALKQAAPKVEFVDSYVEATGLLGFREICELLGINKYTVRDWLVAKGIIYKLGGKWVFSAPWLDSKNGEYRITRNVYGRAVISIKFTPKGFAYIAQRISK